MPLHPSTLLPGARAWLDTLSPFDDDASRLHPHDAIDHTDEGGDEEENTEDNGASSRSPSVSTSAVTSSMKTASLHVCVPLRATGGEAERALLARRLGMDAVPRLRMPTAGMRLAAATQWVSILHG